MLSRVACVLASLTVVLLACTTWLAAAHYRGSPASELLLASIVAVPISSLSLAWVLLANRRLVAGITCASNIVAVVAAVALFRVDNLAPETKYAIEWAVLILVAIEFAFLLGAYGRALWSPAEGR